MYKILIIEDEPAFQDILKDTFEIEQFEVVLADNGKLGIIEATKSFPDFILLDLMMPEMDGATVLRHLKTMPGLKEIPVAVLTVVPDGVPQKLHGDDVFKGIVGFWIKDALTPQKIVQQVKDYLDEQPVKGDKRVRFV